MSANARKIVRLLAQHHTAQTRNLSGLTRLGRVSQVSPVHIETGPGAQIPESALLWTGTAMAIRDTLVVDDTVLLSLLDQNIYVVHDIVSDGP